MASSSKPRAAWEDRFRRPTVDELLDGLNKQLLSLAESWRERMSEAPGVREELSWQGIPFRWTLVYRSENRPERPLAYLVPQPVRAYIAIPIASDAVNRLPLRKLSKPVRDSLGAASLVNGLYWAQWDLLSKSQLDELLLIASACLTDDTVAV